MFDATKIRADFPILSRQVHGHPLTYLDNAATSQKPQAVLDAMDDFYKEHNANIHRGIHSLSEEATQLYEGARQAVADFVKADSAEEIVFTRSATEAINLVAVGWGFGNLKKGDRVVLTEMEHHANLVPWYMLARELSLKLEFVAITKSGELDLADLKRKLKGAKLLAVAHASNVLGTINPIAEITELAHQAGAKVLVDGAQAVPHLPVDMCVLKADWYVFSAHKMLGPTGIGALRTHQPVYEEMQPVFGGGDMIREVGFGEVDFADPPHMFEYGTMPIAEAVGWQAAINYLQKLGMENVRQHEQDLTAYTLKQLSGLEGTAVYGPTDPQKRVGLVSFTIEGIHAHDLATILDQHGVAVRSGHHCAEPLHRKLGVPATARASFGAYNTKDEVDRLVAGIQAAQKTFNSPVSS